MLKVLRALLNAGLNDRSERVPGLRFAVHRIRTLNVLAMLAGGLALGTIPLAIYGGAWQIVPGTLGMVAVVAGVFWLQADGRFYAAAMVMTLLVDAVVTGQVLYLGPEYGVHYWYLPLILIPFFYFPASSAWAPLCLAALCLGLMFFATELDQAHHDLPIAYSRTEILAASFVLALGATFRRYLLQAEQQSAEYVGSIEQQTRDLARFADEDPNAVIRIDRDGRVLYANPPAHDTILTTLGAEVGSILRDFLPSELTSASPATDPVEVEREIEGRIYLLSFRPIPEQAYVNVYGVDITGQLEAERALQEVQDELIRAEKMAGLGTVAAGVAHEIRNPLQAILSLSECIAEDGEIGRIHADTDEIIEAALRIAAIVDDLSAYSRTDNSGEASEVVIEEVIKQALGMARHVNDFEKIEVFEDCLPGLSLRANNFELVQVVVNLVNNAADAMAGTGKLILSSGRDADGLWFSVRDDGPGMDEMTRRRVFEPFFTTKLPGKGVGLGMYVSQRIIGKLGGQLEIASAPGEGATFRARFP